VLDFGSAAGFLSISALLTLAFIGAVNVVDSFVGSRVDGPKK